VSYDDGRGPSRPLAEIIRIVSEVHVIP